ncbi:hypothetical protein [Holzapfeliella sp. JNUCC 72]
MIKNISKIILLAIIVNLLNFLIIKTDVYAKDYSPDTYYNSIVLGGLPPTENPNWTAAIFKFEQNKIIADFGHDRNKDDSSLTVHYLDFLKQNPLYYETQLMDKNGNIKKEVSAHVTTPKNEPLEKWGSVDTEPGDILSVYTFETEKSFWYDQSGKVGNLPNSYLLNSDSESKQSPNQSGDRSRSTLYYIVTDHGFERIKLENLTDVTITEGDSLEQYIHNYFKSSYGQDISVMTNLEFKNKKSGTYTGINVSTTDSKFNQIFQNVFKNGITVHVKPKPVIFDISVPTKLKFNNHTLGLGTNQVALQSDPMVTIEDTRKNSPGWNLSLRSNGKNALAQNLIFKNNNEVQHISNESTIIWSGSGSSSISLAEHLFVQIPNNRSFLAQDYETTLTWNLASTP